MTQCSLVVSGEGLEITRLSAHLIYHQVVTLLLYKFWIVNYISGVFFLILSNLLICQLIYLLNHEKKHTWKHAGRPCLSSSRCCAQSPSQQCNHVLSTYSIEVKHKQWQSMLKLLCRKDLYIIKSCMFYDPDYSVIVGKSTPTHFQNCTSKSCLNKSKSNIMITNKRT